MIIKSVDIVKVRVPLSWPYVMSRGPTYYFENLLVRVHGKEGAVGLGETASLTVVGDVDAVYRILREIMVPKVVGMDSLDIESIVEKLAPANSTDLWATAAIDLALWDLNGKALGLPAYKLLGGLYQRKIPVDYTLGEDSPKGMASRASEMMKEGGFKAFCVKIGGGNDLKTDVARVRAVRDTVGKAVRIRADANGAYNAHTAIAIMQELEPYNLEFLEQPVPRGDFTGLKEIAAAVDIPISVDEGLRHLSDAFALAETRAVKVFNIKVPKCGGLHLSKKIAAVAKSAGIACICGGATALEVIRQASRHFTASTALDSGELSHEGPGPASQALIGNITKRVVTYDDVRQFQGHVLVTDEPGLGVEEDVDAVARYMV
jgi:L-alanine-DL-glutamate epimerase-like enolase superfamily enzyme